MKTMHGNELFIQNCEKIKLSISEIITLAMTMLCYEKWYQPNNPWSEIHSYEKEIKVNEKTSSIILKISYAKVKMIGAI